MDFIYKMKREVVFMQTLQMLAKIVSGGFCGACSIIIGNEIGRGDLNRVNRYCKKFHLTALIVGITSGINDKSNA